MKTAPCSEADIRNIIDICEEVWQALPDKTLLRHNTPEMLASCVKEPNVTLGVWDDGQLVALGVLYVPQCDEEDVANELGLAGWHKAANQKLFVVKEQYRGQGLQRHLIIRLEQIARQKGFDLLCTTCAPNNSHSIGNFEKEGYRFAKTEIKYGGLARNLYYKFI